MCQAFWHSIADRGSDHLPDVDTCHAPAQFADTQKNGKARFYFVFESLSANGDDRVDLLVFVSRN
jgi:hypothetical protein